MSRRKKNGFTLLELLVTTGIGMLIMAIAYQGYQVTSMDVQVRQASQLVGFLTTSADQISAASNAYRLPTAAGAANITTADVITGFASVSNTLPYGSSTSGNQIIGPFGFVTISVMSSSPGANDLVAVDMTQIPKRACSQFLERALSFSHLYDMYVNGALVPLTPAPKVDASGNVVATGRSDIRADLATPLCSATSFSTIRFRKLKDINFTDLRRQELGALSPAEAALIIPLYNRQANAMAAREAAQAAF